MREIFLSDLWRDKLELMIAGIVVVAVIFIVLKFIKLQIKFFMFLIFCMLLGAVGLYVKYGEQALQWLPFDL